MRELAQLSRSERRALTALLTAAVARVGRDDLATDLDRLVADAPVDALPEAAYLHRVSGVVATSLQATTTLPDDVRDELEIEREDSGLHHLMIVGTLKTIADAFNDRGLRWLVMKGPVLASRLYDQPGDRTYGDIDFLVHPEDYGPAIEILEGFGYRHTIRDWVRAKSVMAGQINLAGALLEIDLHWHLHYSNLDRRPFRLDPIAILERSVEVDVGGVTAPVLDPVDRILMLTFHAARSGGHRLVWLKDIERALTIERPDLAEVVARAEAMALAPLVGMILDRAKRVLDAPVDDATLAALLPSGLRVAERAALRLSGPAQMHDNDTPIRFLSRSARPTLLAALTDVPMRGVRTLTVRGHTFGNETDDPDEKAAYLAAVAAER